MRGLALLEHYRRTTSSPEDAENAIRADIATGAAAIVEAAAGANAIHAVSAASVAMMMGAAAGGPEFSVALLEIIALAVLLSPTPRAADDGRMAADDAVQDGPGEQDGSAGNGPTFNPPRLLAGAQMVMDVGSMLPLVRLAPQADSEMTFRTLQREISLRNPIYPHMLLQTLRTVFDDDAVSQDTREVLGFAACDALDVLDAVRTTVLKNLGDRWVRMGAARDASLPMLREMDGDGRPSVPEAEQVVLMREVYEASWDLSTGIDSATVIDIEQVSKLTGHPRNTVAAVLAAYTATDIDSTAFDRFFSGDNPLRPTPIIDDGTGRLMLIHDTLALPALREVIERRLIAARRYERYAKHRGMVVERLAVDLLAAALPGAVVYRDFKYFIPDPHATRPQDQPESFTKRVQGDGLLLIDNVALVIEVKAVAFTPEARAGNPAKLRGKLNDIITVATKQAGRLRRRIVTDRRIRLEDGAWIDVSGVREVHTIAVGLDDLSGVSTATASLIDAGLIDADAVPWTVSLHDLQIICELMERPAELLFYLRRRTNPDATRRYFAVDELDLYLQALERGLYVVPDPDRLTERYPWRGEPSVADRRRFAAQRPEIVASRTDALDDYYNAQLGYLDEVVDKPRLKIDPALASIIDAMAELGSPSWLSTATALLELDGRAQHSFAQRISDMARLSRRDGQSHTFTTVSPQFDGDELIIVVATGGPGQKADDVEHANSLPLYLRAKKFQLGLARASAIIFDSTGTNLLRMLSNTDANPESPGADLADVVSRLVPIERMTSQIPRPGKTPRG